MKRHLAFSGALLLIGFALSGSTCDQFQRTLDVAVTSAPAANQAFQSYVVLNDATLSAVAASNPNNAKLQSIVASVRKGNAIAGESATVLAAYLPAIGVVVDSGALIGKTIGASVATK